MATIRTGGESWKADRQRDFDLRKATLATFPAPEERPAAAHEEMGNVLNSRREIAVSRMPGGVPEHSHAENVASARKGQEVKAEISAQQQEEEDPPPQYEQPPLSPPGRPDFGGIPTETDRWRSQDANARFQRHYETEQGKLTIRQMREAARRGRQQLGVYDNRIGMKGQLADVAKQEMRLHTRRAEFLAQEGDEAVRRSGVEADLLMLEMGLAARDQQRAAEAAALAVEYHQEQEVEAGVQTNAQVEQRQAQIDIISQDADHAMLDANLAADRASAEAAILSAARGAGGEAVEIQEASRESRRARQVGRIGARAETQRKGVRASIKEVESRGRIAKASAVLSRKRARKQYQGAKERQMLIEDTDETRANEIRQAGRREEATLDIQSAQATIASTQSAVQSWAHSTDAMELGFDKEATRVNAELAEASANLGVAMLRDRPPIPDWIEIGKDAKRAQMWQTAGGITSLLASGLNLATKIFKFF